LIWKKLIISRMTVMHHIVCLVHCNKHFVGV
jgi:hypothetical protein